MEIHRRFIPSFLRPAVLAWAAAGLLTACFEPSPPVGDAGEPAMLPSLFRLVGRAADSSLLPADMITASDKPHAILLWLPNDSSGNPASPGINDNWFKFTTVPATPQWPLEFTVDFKGPLPPHAIKDDVNPGKSGLRTALIGLGHKGSQGISIFLAIGGSIPAPYGKFDKERYYANLGHLEPYYYHTWSLVRSLEYCWDLYKDQPDNLAACKAKDLGNLKAYWNKLVQGDTASFLSFRYNYPLHRANPASWQDWFMGLAEDHLLLYIPDGTALEHARSLYDKDGACGNLRLGYNLRRMQRLSPAYDTTWVTSGPDTLGLIELEPSKPEYKVTCQEPDRVEIPLDDRFHLQDPPIFKEL